jgi:hypothetical protein
MKATLKHNSVGTDGSRRGLTHEDLGNTRGSRRALARRICGRLCWAVVLLGHLSLPARGQGYRTPSDVFVLPEKASEETLDQSISRASLRFEGLDLFPHVEVSSIYDDNVLISHTNAINDLRWTLAPGLTVTAGDVAGYVPGSVSLGQLRDLAYFSLLDESSVPQRFIGLDYTPGFNFFTLNPQLNYIDQVQGLAAGYAFSKLALGLDEDFTRMDVKDAGVGDLVTLLRFDTKLRSRYQLNDRSSVEVNALYDRLRYADGLYQGYDEVQNEDWFNRLVGAKLEAGIGAAFGIVYPQASANQTYQQGLVRGIYRLTSKLDFRASMGIEFRQYDSGQSATTEPVFSVSANYRPQASTTLTLEAHRRQEPSYTGTYNQETTGFNAGVRQQLSGGLSATLAGGYEDVTYLQVVSGPSNNRVDNTFWVRASLDYEFNRHLTGALFYTVQQDNSSNANYSYTDNMVGVRAVWRY